MIRLGEDVAAQAAAVTEARAALAVALDVLADAAKRAARAAHTKTGQPDLPGVYAATNAVRRAEENLDTATYDLATASGEHG